MITTIVAILGFLLGMASLLWHIYTYRVTHKEDIKGELSLNAVPTESGKGVVLLWLRLWNNGSVAVYLKSVMLCWGDEGSKLGNVVSSLLFTQTGPKKNPLKPGDGTSYVLTPAPKPLLSAVAKLPEGKIWVSVKSQRGEVLRLQGEDLKEYLSKIANLPDKGKKND